MKKNLLLAALAMAGLASCKENGPLIDFSGIVAKDTTYMSTPPANAQPRNILIEEFTGIKCVNCPDGHAVVTGLETTYPGRIIPIAIHPKNNPLADPLPNISPIDFRTDEGTTVCAEVYGNPTAIPSAGIDRKPYNSLLVLGRDVWPVAVQARMAAAPMAPVTMSLSSVYEASSNSASVKVTATYTSAISAKQVLTLALVEDDIDAPQEYNGATGGPEIHTSYIHNHILRRIYTFATGSPMIDSIAIKAPGRVYERTFIIKTDPSWKPENCKLVAFVSNNESGDKEVMQAVETKLQP